MDGPHQRRVLCEVLDQDPTHDDIRPFLVRLKAAIAARGSELRGITTDGPARYPIPLAEVVPEVPHRACEFHVLKEVTKAVLRAWAGVRKTRTSRVPELSRGRPRDDAVTRRRVRKAERIKHRVTDLFEPRHLFVRHILRTAQRDTSNGLVRGEPMVMALRTIMDEVDRLFDRRRCTDTALGKLVRLRRHVRRDRSLGRARDKVNAPNPEKALTFLDDRLMPSTSNAVERSSRRHREMQKPVDRVRTKANLEGRLALDLQRERQTTGRRVTTKIHHKQRRGE